MNKMLTNAQASTRLWEYLEKNQPPEARDIIYLSNLLADDIARLTQLWPKLTPSIRRHLIQQLYHSTEADFEIDFSAVFHIALLDGDANIRATAIEGLHNNNDIRLVARFAQILHHDTDVTVRVKAAQALAYFVLHGELEKIHARTFARARKALLQTYHNSQEDVEVRRRALESLAYTGLDNLPDLIATAYAQSEAKWRVSAVFAMGRSADPRWSQTVRQELYNPNPEMRFEATRACGELEIRETVPTLVEMTEDVDSEIQQMALWSLGQIGGAVARATLTRYSNSDRESLCQAASEALDELDFFQGDLDAFFGPPSTFDGESDISWDATNFQDSNIFSEDTDE